MPPLHEGITVPAADPPNFGEIPVGEALAGKSRRARRVGRGDGDRARKGSGCESCGLGEKSSFALARGPRPAFFQLLLVDVVFRADPFARGD